MHKSKTAATWDLSDYYKSINDSQIEKDIDKISKKIKSFSKKFKNKIKRGQTFVLLEALTKYSHIIEASYHLSIFAHLSYDKQTDSEEIGAFFQRINEFSSKVRAETGWFEIELTQIPNRKFNKILTNAKLTQFRHFLAKIRQQKPFKLGEKEEKILTLKSQSGAEAFKRLYNQLSSTTTYTFWINNKKQEMNFSQISPYLSYHPVRDVRRRAALAVSKTQELISKQNAYLLNTLVLDKKIDDDLRKFKFPQQSTFLNDELSKEIVDSMINTVSSRYDIVERFYNTKRKILGYRKLYEWDRYSPLFPTQKNNYTWSKAQKLVLDAFKDFLPLFYKIACKFFQNHWIDSQISPSKRGGAYCSLGTPSKHPYILMNFTGEQNDVRTLAHELGHAIHAYVAQSNNILQFYPSTPILEIASVFAEMLVFEKLYSDTTDKRQKLELLSSKIQDSFATIFRPVAFYLFESDVHEHRKTKGELSVEEINNYFQNRLQEMFGSALTLTSGHRFWWGYVQHFYFFNFYAYSYAFGEALTNTLYAQYKNEGDKFVKRYLLALQAGGSLSPQETVNILRLDIRKSGFWQKGLDLIKSQVEEFEALAREVI